MSRITTRILLGLAAFIAILVIAISFNSANKGVGSAWAVIAASLAVLTPIVSAAICQGSCRMNVNFFFSTLGPLHAAIWTTSSLLPFGGFNQT